MSHENGDTRRAGFGWIGHAQTPVSPYLTAIEAALYLRTTVQGVYSLVKRGRLRPMPGSGKLLFTRESLDACLQKRRR
jgi:excisionase family DNA binding protein